MILPMGGYPPHWEKHYVILHIRDLHNDSSNGGGAPHWEKYYVILPLSDLHNDSSNGKAKLARRRSWVRLTARIAGGGEGGHPRVMDL